VMVLPMSVGHAGWVLELVPAVVHWKTRPDACKLLARTILPTL